MEDVDWEGPATCCWTSDLRGAGSSVCACFHFVVLVVFLEDFVVDDDANALWWCWEVVSALAVALALAARLDAERGGEAMFSCLSGW